MATDNSTHEKVLALARVVRKSFHDSSVYQYGGCYGFFRILKHTFPHAQPYFDDKNENHILAKIGDRFYDIKGEQLPNKDDEPIPLTIRDIERWEAIAAGQTLERIAAKYKRMTNIIAKENE